MIDQDVGEAEVDALILTNLRTASAAHGAFSHYRISTSPTPSKGGNVSMINSNSHYQETFRT